MEIDMSNFKKMLSTAVSLAVALSFLTGCSGQWGSSSDTEQGYAYGSGVNGGPAFMGKDGRLATNDKAVQDVFYFPFDRSELDSEARAELKTHARYLTNNPNVKVRVEGHTDERGSREYNVALGERRAKAVANELFSEGVSRDQVAVVSYGTEKPAVQGHNENAWKWNRRGKVAYELG